MDFMNELSRGEAFIVFLCTGYLWYKLASWMRKMDKKYGL